MQTILGWVLDHVVAYLSHVDWNTLVLGLIGSAVAIVKRQWFAPSIATELVPPPLPQDK